MLIEMHTDEGLVGIGETAGREALEHHGRCAEALVGCDPLAIRQNVAKLKARGERPAAISGVEMAMWDLLGKACGLPLFQLLGGCIRDRVKLCGLMGVKAPDGAADTAEQYVRTWGFASIKTKAGRSVDEDVAIAQAIHKRVGLQALLRFDANESYQPEDVIALAATYRQVNLEYVEQPVSRQQLGSYRQLREKSGVPIALNESVTDAASVLAIARQSAADALVVDIPDAGGILAVQDLAAVAEAVGLPCAFHCWHDFGVKTAAMAHLVSALPAFSLASDTTYHGLEADIIAEPFVIQQGRIQVPTAPGLGVQLAMDVIERYRKKVID
ncbi:mandelate racemase/muconate lactonizing enzyme family protein [Marinobacter sp. CA1]|uniref:mandelate racemase/muconate lactonizing enzyme family protein n=1 Tax=Marinobacter sp. CA1 TaxID=2817656 RepID=UPI00226BBD72|nr:mandelate racemase/muconate lactonizing enzyme family protein [Marinobacter sp. CA1]UDL03797.1 mandelate racemase/muconate lactonizing enzyme family protein [Marinobacter sp. CA1]